MNNEIKELQHTLNIVLSELATVRATQDVLTDAIFELSKETLNADDKQLFYRSFCNQLEKHLAKSLESLQEVVPDASVVANRGLSNSEFVRFLRNNNEVS